MQKMHQAIRLLLQPVGEAGQRFGAGPKLQQLRAGVLDGAVHADIESELETARAKWHEPLVGQLVFD